MPAQGDTDTRTALLDSAIELFSRRGYEAVGVQEIVESRGVTKPTLYHHFGSKEGLLRVALERDGGELCQRVALACAYEHDVKASLERVAFCLLGFARERPDFYRMLMAMRYAPPDSLPNALANECVSGLSASLERLFQEAAKDHGNMKGRHRAYAAAFLGAMDARAMPSLNGGKAYSDAEIRQAIHHFMHGIFS
jgi:AcrR family transcriptional regulator